MPTFEVCCTATLEIYITVEADNKDEAELRVHSNVNVIDYANNTVGAESEEYETVRVTQVLGHPINEIVSIEEGA